MVLLGLVLWASSFHCLMPELRLFVVWTEIGSGSVSLAGKARREIQGDGKARYEGSRRIEGMACRRMALPVGEGMISIRSFPRKDASERKVGGHKPC